MNIPVFANLIHHETARALLVKCPGSDWRFWHPKALATLSGKSEYILTLRLLNPEYTLFREGKAGIRLAERTVTREELCDLLAPATPVLPVEHAPIRHMPTLLVPTPHQEPLEELRYDPAANHER